MLLNYLFNPFKFIYNWCKKKHKNPNSRRIYVVSPENTIENDFTTQVVYSPTFKEFRFDENIIINPNSPIALNNLRNYQLTSPSPIKKRKKMITDCCICLEKLSSKKTIKLNDCSHEIHFHCIKKWLKKNNDCPLCRTDQIKLRIRLDIVKIT